MTVNPFFIINFRKNELSTLDLLLIFNFYYHYLICSDVTASNVSVKSGESVSLTCSISEVSPDSTSITWTPNSDEDPKDTYNDTTLVQESVLTITTAPVQDADYTCKVNSSDWDEVIKETIHIDVFGELS